jgi:3-oxoacyl-(acyl-carrier-protein) synthase
MPNDIVITATALALADVTAPDSFQCIRPASGNFCIHLLPVEMTDGRHTIPSQRMARMIETLAERAGLTPVSFMGPATGIVSGSRYGCSLVFEMNRRLRKHGPRGIDAVGFAQATHSFPVSACSIDFGIQGPGVAFVSSYAAGMEALLCAQDWLREGRCDQVIVAGFEDLHGPASSHLSEVCAPIGSAIHEAMALILLERGPTARARRAPILAELRGTAMLRPGLDSAEVRHAADRAFGTTPAQLRMLLVRNGAEPLVDLDARSTPAMVDCLAVGGLLALIRALESGTNTADWLIGAIDPHVGGVAAGIHVTALAGAA